MTGNLCKFKPKLLYWEIPLVHFGVNHALQTCAKIVQIHTVDTDVVVILASMFQDLTRHYPEAEIWCR